MKSSTNVVDSTETMFNFLTSVITVFAAIYYVISQINLYTERQHELDKIEKDNQLKLAMKKLDNDKYLAEKKQMLEYQLELSETERQFESVNNVILEICEKQTAPRKVWL